MKMCRCVLLAMCLLIPGSLSLAAEFKVALLAPEGTSWASTLKRFSQEASTLTQGETTWQFLFGGLAGDDQAVLQKLKTKELDGALLSGAILSDLYPAVRAAEVPFRFGDNREAAWTFIKKNQASWEKGLQKQGFLSLGIFEVGFVYVVSDKKISRLSDVDQMKVWQWPQDPIVAETLKKLRAVPVEAAIPEVLRKLGKGELAAAYAPPLGILGLQWQTKTKFLLKTPLCFGTGAFLVRQEAWNKLKKEQQSKIQELAKNYIKEANDQTDAENHDALKFIEKAGVTFVELDTSEKNKMKNIGEEVRKALKLP